MTIVCLLIISLHINGCLGDALNWGKTAEDRTGYAFAWGAAFEATPILLFGLICSVIGWRYGDNRRISMLCSVIHIAFLSVLLAELICFLVAIWWSGSNPVVDMTN